MVCFFLLLLGGGGGLGGYGSVVSCCYLELSGFMWILVLFGSMAGFCSVGASGFF